MRTRHLAILLFLLAAIVGVRSPARADDTPGAKPGNGPGSDEKPGTSPEEEAGLVWLEDLDEAKDKAKEEKKGLFVYLTPDWFT